MKPRFLFLVFSVLAGAALVSLAGCTQKSYPSEKIKESLVEICRKEYGIEEIDVKILGSTIGVYLPLKKLFASDFKEAVDSGKIRNLETLFEPAPEALEKVEDVLFSISRVLLSTDKKLNFYVLQATDIEKTGMQLVLNGYVDDIKRVRIWDISRNEYRKRVIHELRLNRAVIWHKSVREFFKDLETLNVEEVREKYFQKALPAEAVQTLFFNVLLTGRPDEARVRWDIVDLRSQLIQKNEVLVYAKVRPYREGEIPSGDEDLQYLFMLALDHDQPKIARIIPFQYRDNEANMQRIPFPKELQMQENLEGFEQEFPLEEIHLGPFLAQQLSRRVQALLSGDERIQNTFHEIKLNFGYHEEPPRKYFSLDLEAVPRDASPVQKNSLVYHEDMLYLLNVASREFVDVLRSYQFGDFEYLSLNLVQEPASWVLPRDGLELFRRKKVDVQGLLGLAKF